MTSRNDGPPVLGIDLGGTKILVGVVSGSQSDSRSCQANDAGEGRGSGDRRGDHGVRG